MTDREILEEVRKAASRCRGCKSSYGGAAFQAWLMLAPVVRELARRAGEDEDFLMLKAKAGGEKDDQ